MRIAQAAGPVECDGIGPRDACDRARFRFREFIDRLTGPADVNRIALRPALRIGRAYGEAGRSRRDDGLGKAVWIFRRAVGEEGSSVVDGQAVLATKVPEARIEKRNRKRRRRCPVSRVPPEAAVMLPPTIMSVLLVTRLEHEVPINRGGRGRGATGVYRDGCADGDEDRVRGTWDRAGVPGQIVRPSMGGDARDRRTGSGRAPAGTPGQLHHAGIFLIFARAAAHAPHPEKYQEKPASVDAHTLY